MLLRCILSACPHLHSSPLHLSLPPVFHTHTHSQANIHTYIHTHRHTHIRTPTRTLPLCRAANTGSRSILALWFTSVLVKGIILASLLLDIHGFMPLHSTFFPVSVVYITGMSVFLWEFQIRIRI